MKLYIAILLTMLVSFSRNALSADPAAGTIGGVVLDMKNSPLTGANIAIRELKNAGQGSRRFLTTDQSGRFSASNVPVGNYLVIATKDETRMQSPRAFAPPNSTATVVAVGPDLPGARIVVRIGSRTGVVAGRIRDAVTGKLVVAKVQIVTVSSGQSLIFAACPGGFRIPLPSEVGLQMSVSAPGYQTWTQSDASGFSVHRGERKRMDVLLQPATQ